MQLASLTFKSIRARAVVLKLKRPVVKAMRYLIPALQDFGAMLKGRRVAPIELYDLARKSLHFVGYQGLSMIAVSGLDMAAWDALAMASGVPLCVCWAVR
jgi:mandelate racemase